MAERAFSTGADARPHPLNNAPLRARMELAVERLLAAMDVLDALSEDMEDDDAAEDGGDAEPSLGAPEDRVCQIVWLLGGGDDLEDDPADLGIADYEGI